MIDLDEIEARSRGRSRPKSGRVLAIRVLQAKVAWLDAPLRWQDGRVVWVTETGPLLPTASDFARTQRSLYKVREYPRSAEAALGDVDGWLEQRQAALEQAKSLARLECDDFESLGRQARRGDQASLTQLARLLEAEALCLNELPLSPAALLAECRSSALPALRTTALGGVARVLSAWVEGAHAQSPSGRVGVPTADLTHAAERIAFRLGSTTGLLDHPGLVADLLHRGVDADAVMGVLEALDSSAPFSLDAETLRTLLRSGCAPPTVCRLAAVIRILDPLWDRLTTAVAPEGRRNRPAEITALRRAAREQAAEVARLSKRYLIEGRLPEMALPLLRVIEIVFALAPKTPGLMRLLVRVLEEGLGLPEGVRPGYLTAVDACRDRIWDRSEAPESISKEAVAPDGWLNHRWEHNGRPIIKLLAQVSDADLVIRLSERGLVSEALHRETFADRPLPASFWTALLDMIAAAELPASAVPGSLFCIIRRCRTAEDPMVARTALRNLGASLQSVPVNQRSHFIKALGRATPYEREGARRTLGWLSRRMPALLAAQCTSAEERRCCHCHSLTQLAARLILAGAGDEAERTLTDLLGWERELRREEDGSLRSPTWQEECRFELGVSLAAALGNRQAESILEVLKTVYDHGLTLDDDIVRAFSSVMERVPRLRGPLRSLFIRQPKRGLRAMRRLAILNTLGYEAYSWLSAPATPPEDVPEAWKQVTALHPDLAALVVSYRSARIDAGLTDEVPAGVQSWLRLPEKLRREWEHLRKAATAKPELAARRDSLAERLAQPDALTETVAEGVREALEIAVAEAEGAALEMRIEQCVRRRLEVVIGALPEKVELDEDLVNAALLTAGVEKNRKVLRRLLRAHLQGDTEWVDQLPANREYLARMESAGVNISAWLSERLRRHRCPGVRGGWIYIRLERNPLRVLQMGNPFDTCLSLGECNSYSTVANAVDRNKRVLYVTDRSGRIIGRKLLAISEEGKLLGFNSYCLLDSGDGPAGEARALHQRAVRDYCLRWARECGLELADEGEVPRIVSEAWYDDGAIGWSTFAKPRKKRSGRGAPEPGGIGTLGSGPGT